MKEVKIFAYALGAYYCIIGVLNPIIMYLVPDMKSFYSNIGGMDQSWMYDNVHKIQHAYASATPWLIPIGLGFLAFGWLMAKITSGRLVYLAILSLLSLIWAVYSCVYICPLMGHIYDDFPIQNDIIKGMGLFIQVICVVTTLVQFTLPQFFMAREIVKMERKKDDLVE